MVVHLKREQEAFAYPSLQQVILDALREHCFLHNQGKKPKKEKREGPKVLTKHTLSPINFHSARKARI